MDVITSAAKTHSQKHIQPESTIIDIKHADHAEEPLSVDTFTHKNHTSYHVIHMFFSAERGCTEAPQSVSSFLQLHVRQSSGGGRERGITG